MKVKILFLGLALSLSLIRLNLSFSQTVENEVKKVSGVADLIFETLLDKERENLIELYNKDKEVFENALRKRIFTREKELEKMREGDPRKFEETLEKARIRMRDSVTKVIEEYPQIFEELWQKQQEGLEDKKNEWFEMLIIFDTLPEEERKAIAQYREKYQDDLKKALKKRIQELKVLDEEDSGKFREVMDNARKTIEERLDQARKYQPQKFEELKKINPQYLQDQLEWLKERDPDFYNELVETMASDKTENKTVDNFE